MLYVHLFRAEEELFKTYFDMINVYESKMQEKKFHRLMC